MQVGTWMRPASLALGARCLIVPALTVAFLCGLPPALSFASGAVCPPEAGSSRPPQLPARVDAGQLFADLHALAAPAMEGRRSGTAGSRRAQAFILERFERLGLQPVGGAHRQIFPLAGSGRGESSPGSEGVNLVGLVPGRQDAGQFVLVSAHYDHVGVRGGHTYPGADDNASGVAAMLAIASWFARNPPDHSIVFIAFDAEELGLAGSRRFVSNPPIDLGRVTALVNLDMVGRGDDNTLVVAGTHHSPALKPVVAAATEGRHLKVRFGHDRPASEAAGERDWTQLSDHGPFHSAGVPFLYFGVEDHRDYHRATDTPDRIPRRFFVEATELVLDTVRRLAGGDRRGDRSSVIGGRTAPEGDRRAGAAGELMRGSTLCRSPSE